MPPKEDNLKENIKKDIKNKKKKLKESDLGFNYEEQVGVTNRKRKRLKLIAIRPDKINLTKPPQDVQIGSLTLV